MKKTESKTGEGNGTPIFFTPLGIKVDFKTINVYTKNIYDM